VLHVANETVGDINTNVTMATKNRNIFPPFFFRHTDAGRYPLPRSDRFIMPAAHWIPSFDGMTRMKKPPEKFGWSGGSKQSYRIVSFIQYIHDPPDQVSGLFFVGNKKGAPAPQIKSDAICMGFETPSRQHIVTIPFYKYRLLNAREKTLT
jgi:hypothetical protein